MNELIEEIAERAAQEVRVEHDNPYWRMQDEIKEDSAWREKFAQLIVKECCSIVMADKVISWGRLYSYLW